MTPGESTTGHPRTESATDSAAPSEGRSPTSSDVAMVESYIESDDYFKKTDELATRLKATEQKIGNIITTFRG
jgi:hypothetical protein